MATVNLPKSRRLVLYDIDWTTYRRLLRAFEERPGIRLTYDRGTLEIMSPSQEHEGVAYLLGRFVDVLTDELKWRVIAGRTTTFRKRRKKRGLEPDNSYWIASEPLIRGKERIDLRVDPPPDLAIEVDVSHSSVNRMGIYATLGVAEVWRLAEQVLSFHVLGSEGEYAVSATSRAFAFLSSADVQGFLSLRGQQDENSIVRQFREWLRQRQNP